MTKKTSETGASVMEIMLVVAILGAVTAAIVLFFTHSTPMFQRLRVRQHVMMESRGGMDTIIERLRNGKYRTLTISTPALVPSVPNSRVDFVLQSTLPSGATAYAIFLDNLKVFTQEFAPSTPGGLAPRLLMSNVTGLKFEKDDYLGIAKVTLRMDVPWDETNDPSHVSTIILPSQAVHMVESE